MKRVLALSVSVLTIAFSQASYATNLVDAFDAALKSDPIYKQAEATYNSNKTAVGIARAGILPSIDIQASLNRAKSTIGVSDNFPGSASSTYQQNQGYALTVTQPIFNWQAFKQIQQAQASVQSAAATYSAAGQNLIIRLASAYFKVLQAQDILRYSESQEKALYRQYEVSSQRYNVGLDPITSLYKAQAAYDAAKAEYIADQNDLDNAREELREITGTYYSDLKTLAGDFPLVSPQPMNIDQWVKTALEQNLSLRASRFNVLAAQENIKVQSAGTLPTLSATGSYQDTNTRSLPENQQGTQNARAGTIGLALNFPVYNGGINGAQTEQAEAQYQLAIAQMEQQYRATVADARKAFLSVNSQISQVEADRQSVKSHVAALESIQAGYQAGTQTILDVLQAQSDLFNAEQNYTQDRFSYLLNTLKLKEAAGILTPNDLVNINRWLYAEHSLPTQPIAPIKKAGAKKRPAQKANVKKANTKSASNNTKTIS